MQVQTAWVKPPARSGGLDHIGIQQLPIRIFSTLLPGITVVTDKIANYSFYPWVAWCHAQHYGGGLDFVHFLRRAECLATLIAERHAQETGEADRFHGRGLVGRASLTRFLRDDAQRPIDFGWVAALRSENQESYFKNRFGGLGQYYLGPLRDLGVLQRVEDRVEVSEDLGVPLAKAFDLRVDRAAFLQTVDEGLVDEQRLDALVRFCPCNMSDNEAERSLLQDLMLGTSKAADEGAHLRRATLGLLLDFSAARGADTEEPLDAAFKAASVARALDDAAPWEPPKTWEPVLRAWAAYERNDHLSVACLGVFWVALTLLDDEGGLALHGREVGALVTAQARASLGDVATTRVSEAIERRRSELPLLASWVDETHEFQLGYEVERAARAGETVECLKAALDVLLALAARHDEDQPYIDAGITSEYLANYPLNLRNFFASVRDRWASLTVAEWLGELASSWGVEAHLRVALKKLHRESKDTFLVRMTDDGLRRPDDGKEPPLPSFTASRLNRAVQFLVDLGLATWEHPAGRGAEDDGEDDDRRWVAQISDSGRKLLEVLRG